MDKTKVDDIIIEMIKPKIEEIEKKFSNNQPLSQDDINTLLLKSQYNHINHLDKKLNETVDSVKGLESKFEKLELKFNYLEEKLTNDMKNLEEKLTGDMKNLEERLTNDMKNLEERLVGDMKNLEGKIEITIQKALNKNMLLMITILGGFFTILKIAEIFAK